MTIIAEKAALEDVYQIGTKAEPVGQFWLRTLGDRLGVNTYAVQGLLDMARNGATLEVLAERHRTIRAAIADPKRLEKAGHVFAKVLDGERQVWPATPKAVQGVPDKFAKTVSRTFTPSGTQKPEVPDKRQNRGEWGKRSSWGGR